MKSKTQFILIELLIAALIFAAGIFFLFPVSRLLFGIVTLPSTLFALFSAWLIYKS